MTSIKQTAIENFKNKVGELASIDFLENKQWIELDENNNMICKYLFNANTGELIKSLSNIKSILNWKFDDVAKSLKIKDGPKEEVYVKGYITEEMVIFKKDVREDYLFLIEENYWIKFSSKRTPMSSERIPISSRSFLKVIYIVIGAVLQFLAEPLVV